MHQMHPQGRVLPSQTDAAIRDEMDGAATDRSGKPLDLLADAQRFDALPLGYSTAPQRTKTTAETFRKCPARAFPQLNLRLSF
jgi:hypothetical protein